MVLSSERLDIIQSKLEQTNEGILKVLRESSFADTSSSTTSRESNNIDQVAKKKLMDENFSNSDGDSLVNKSIAITSSSEPGEFFATKDKGGYLSGESVCMCIYMYVLISYVIRIVAKGDLMLGFTLLNLSIISFPLSVYIIQK